MFSIITLDAGPIPTKKKKVTKIKMSKLKIEIYKTYLWFPDLYFAHFLFIYFNFFFFLYSYCFDFGTVAYSATQTDLQFIRPPSSPS